MKQSLTVVQVTTSVANRAFHFSNKDEAWGFAWNCRSLGHKTDVVDGMSLFKTAKEAHEILAAWKD